MGLECSRGGRETIIRGKKQRNKRRGESDGADKKSQGVGTEYVVII